MKIKQIIIAGTLLVSVASFAQKDELKALKKIYAKDEIKGDDLANYKTLVEKVQSLATEEGDKIYANFYKSMTPILDMMSLDKTSTPLQIQMQMAKSLNPKNILQLAKGLNETLDYEKKSGKKIYTDDINETIMQYKPEIQNYVAVLGKQKKYKEGAEVLYSLYQLDKKDQDKLYFAANYAIEAQDWDKALDYLKELKAINYSGEGIAYYALNKTNQVEEFFNDKAQRDLFIKAGSHEKPRDEKTPSKKGEIVKNLALILVQQGKAEEAKTALSDARKLNPDDTNLILTEADVYYKLNDIENYKKLINEALQKKPNDVELLFNLGVVSGKANQIEDAEKYYLKVIELDPSYTNAYLNLANIKLIPDEKLVEEMNKLGTSDKDMKRYTVLKADRQKLFNTVMPILEKAHDLSPDNKDVSQVLMSVYKYLELNDTDKFKALKAKL